MKNPASKLAGKSTRNPILAAAITYAIALLVVPVVVTIVAGNPLDLYPQHIPAFIARDMQWNLLEAVLMAIALWLIAWVILALSRNRNPLMYLNWLLVAVLLQMPILIGTQLDQLPRGAQKDFVSEKCGIGADPFDSRIPGGGFVCMGTQQSYGWPIESHTIYSNIKTVDPTVHEPIPQYLSYHHLDGYTYMLFGESFNSALVKIFGLIVLVLSVRLPKAVDNWCMRGEGRLMLYICSVILVALSAAWLIGRLVAR